MRLAIFGLALGTSLLLAAPDARAQEEVLTWAEIHATLDPHGTWVDVAEYGPAWRPTGVRTSWQPYSEGHWEREGLEWLWVSDFKWGWLPFHYGRWYSHANFGWVWIPGFDYAPSWTVWRDADEYSAWAPLPPGPCWRGTSFIGVVPVGGWVYTPRAVFRSRVVHFRPLYRRPQVRYVHRAHGPYVRPRAYRAGRRHVRPGRPPPHRVVRNRRGNVLSGPRARGGVHRRDVTPGRRVHPRGDRTTRYRPGHPPDRGQRRVTSSRGRGRTVRGRPVRAPVRRKPAVRRDLSHRSTPTVRRAAPRRRTVTPAPTRGTRGVRKAKGYRGRTRFRTSAGVSGAARSSSKGRIRGRVHRGR